MNIADNIAEHTGKGVAIRSNGGHRVDRELTGVEHNVCDRLAHLQDYGLLAGKRTGREIGGEPELISLRANRFG